MSRLLIQFAHLSKSFGSLPIFDDISLSINEGEIFSLIGENGAGKTTLLELLVGRALPDSGEIVRAPLLTLGYLPQEVESSLKISVRKYLEEGTLSQIEEQMASLLENPDRLFEWEELHEKYERLGGYDRMPIEKALLGLKLDASLLDLSLATLSSGQRMRVALAKSLIDNPDLLLLDEPTNHLDSEMLQWLGKTLRERKGATVIVSHDRKFINSTCNLLIEIGNGKLSRYGGNYDFYLEEKKGALERQMRAYEAQEEERALLKQKIKATIFAKAKAPAPSDRNFMAYDQRGEQHQKSLARNLGCWKGRLQEIEEKPLPHPKPKSIKGLRFTSTPLASNSAIELEGVSIGYGDKTLFTDLNFSLSKGDRIILTGPNGSGKTTLLRSIARTLPIQSGQIRIAPSVKICILDQEIEELPLEKTPLEYFEDRFSLTEETLRKELHKAALGGEALLNRPISSLSVGQRKRLTLLSLILEKPNVLLLDEPTNHLDLLTLEALETALLEFEGAIIAVSHDPTFIEKIATQVIPIQSL